MDSYGQVDSGSHESCAEREVLAMGPINGISDSTTCSLGNICAYCLDRGLDPQLLENSWVDGFDKIGSLAPVKYWFGGL